MFIVLYCGGMKNMNRELKMRKKLKSTNETRILLGMLQKFTEIFEINCSSLVSPTLVINLSPVTTTLVINLSLVTTPVNNYRL